MSLVGTRLKDSESLFFGFAELFIGDSASNESSTTAVLVEDDYFSSMAEISFTVSKKFIKKYGTHLGTKILTDIALLGSEFEVTATFVELTEKNLSLALGGDGTDTNILDNLFSQPESLRVELIFSYPNKTNTMTLILPKTKIETSNIEFSFEAEEAMQLPIKITPLKSTNSAWSSNPLGKIIFA